MTFRSRNLENYYRPTDPNDRAAALIKSIIHRQDDERHARRHAVMTCMICIPVEINYGRIGQYLKLWDRYMRKRQTKKQTNIVNWVHTCNKSRIIKWTQWVEFFDKIKRKKLPSPEVNPGLLVIVKRSIHWAAHLIDGHNVFWHYIHLYFIMHKKKRKTRPVYWMCV